MKKLVQHLIAKVPHRHSTTERTIGIDLEMSAATAARSTKLIAWGHEMGDCEKVDPEFHERYRNTYTVATYDRVVRLERFLEGHNLYEKFIAEDGQGKR